MNPFSGVLNLDQSLVQRERLAKCVYRSPRWIPDFESIEVHANLGLVCTQRTVTPESAFEQMPLRESATGCLLVADSYLSHREELARDLGISQVSDGELILRSYLKWGEKFPERLHGSFAIALWDPRYQKLLLITDHFGSRPLFFSYQKGKHVVFATTMAPFRILCPDLTINENMMRHFALDSLPPAETCYREVTKLKDAQALIISPERISEKRYWSLTHTKAPRRLKSREAYYQSFQELFTQTVGTYCRSQFPISAHISGGLDSSSVAAAAAGVLAESNRPLIGLTAVPHGLNGPSYRAGWNYHDMPLVKELLAAYPNIRHFICELDPTRDPLKLCSQYFAWTDQPFRNITNLDWILSTMERASSQGSRLLLSGQKGNATISWPGWRKLGRLKHFFRTTGSLKKPNWVAPYFSRHNPDFLRSPQGRKILKSRLAPSYRSPLLSSWANSPRAGSIRPILLYEGVEVLDPTFDRKIVEFCFHLPDWVYHKGRGVLDKRLLVREGLKNILPEGIRVNPRRGEQAADWYLHYNQFAAEWKKKHLQMTSGPVGSFLSQWYDTSSMSRLFDEYKTIEKPNDKATSEVSCNLLRHLSLGFYLEYLTEGP